MIVAASPSYKIGQNVPAFNFWNEVTWVAGVVVKKLGSLMYLIQVKSGIFWSCLVDHIVDSSTESK